MKGVGREPLQLMRQVASGRKGTWAEHWKVHDSLVLFDPVPLNPVPLT